MASSASVAERTATDAVGGAGLDGDLYGVDGEGGGDVGAHGVDVGVGAGCAQDDERVDAGDLEAGVADVGAGI